ncbi:phage tail sheath subtilisin-like domain-containing protein [Pseudogemmobacter blasticus]|uniref:Phage tail protein n=1 Tax=Fuscovulum blasticum DSM 2131 TaxID=1188250 RepID=A0A2T4JDC5_FUSBL|nr:phage tail sheath subtilisin-like domain-containing protein [Fuscovulum blasticum]PTE15912.1 phage tail protein [Fuscovulum blasticum DSM 2131]
MPEQFLHGIETVEIDDGLRPIQTVKSSIIGLVGTAPAADINTFPLDTPVLVTGPRLAAKLGVEGTLLDAYNAAYAQGVSVAIVVRVAAGATSAETITAVAGTPAGGDGVWALLNATNLLGQTPRILAAPGWTSTPAADPASPVTQALGSVATRLRAVAIADGPNTTEADALTDRAKYGSDRLYIVDPAVRAWDSTTSTYVTRPASAYVAGALSAIDASRGFWWSPSNQVLQGVAGTARPISWGISDTDTEANRLNEKEVATIVRKNGFRLWGNRSTSTDPLWTFLPVRRTADMIYESIEEALLWAMDRPFSAQLLRDIRDSVQAYLDTLKTRGALLGGRVWIDPEANTETTLKAGKLFIDFDIEPPAPLEHLTMQARRNGDYYEELVTAVTTGQ